MSNQEEEEEVPFVLDLEEQVACIVECLDDDMKKKVSNTFEEFNKRKLKEIKKWEKQQAGKKQVNHEKLSKLTNVLSWLCPVMIAVCAALSVHLWDTSQGGAIFIAVVGFIFLFALLLSVISPIQET